MAWSCNRTNDELRNRILFTDNIDSVQEALIQTITYLDSLPNTPEGDSIGIFYAIDNNNLKINGLFKRKLDNSLKIPGLSSTSSLEFIHLITFLKKNSITSATKSGYNFWYFGYKELDYPEHDYYRDIIVMQKSNDTIGLYVENKVIDQKKNLLLVAPISREEFLKNYNEIKNKNKN